MDDQLLAAMKAMEDVSVGVAMLVGMRKQLLEAGFSEHFAEAFILTTVARQGS